MKAVKGPGTINWNVTLWKGRAFKGSLAPSAVPEKRKGSKQSLRGLGEDHEWSWQPLIPGLLQPHTLPTSVHTTSASYAEGLPDETTFTPWHNISRK